MTWLCSLFSLGLKASRAASSSFLFWIRSFFLCTSSSVRMTGAERGEGETGKKWSGGGEREKEEHS
jgi:hypothetical protein